jgi:RHS repeat-associated protein
VVSEASDEHRLVRSFDGRIEREHTFDGREVRYRYDALGRIERRDVAGAATHFAYDPLGRLLERQHPARGAVRYEYDAQGRLVTKREGQGEAERVWRYGWNGAGLLASVETPDGIAVAFTYDVFARRIDKHVWRAGRLEREVHYGWRGDALVYEERREHGPDGVRRTERTYPTVPGARLPFAQREVVDGQAGLFEQLLTGPTGLPVAVVRGDGQAVRALEGDLYGQLPAGQAGATATRFVGQWYDEETGLHYNRHRYYDPETGCYLSPEPLGLEGSLKAYAYTDNYPVDAVDPNGLERSKNILTRTQGPDIITESGRSQGAAATNYIPKDISNSQLLHPAVVVALPPMNARDKGRAGGPDSCAEPLALSRHLHDWEKKNKPRRCNPPDKDWQNHLGSALDQITSIRTNANKGQGDPLAACSNCGQTIPRLWALAGKAPPNANGGIYKGGVENPDRESEWTKKGAEVTKKQNNVLTDKGQSKKDEVMVKPVTFYDERDPQNKTPVFFQDKNGNAIEPGRFTFDPTRGWVLL